MLKVCLAVYQHLLSLCFLDITLSAPQPTSVLLPATARLRFLAYVAADRIPLYLAASPSYDVSSGSKHTQQWFHDALLSHAAMPDAPARAAKSEETQETHMSGWLHSRMQSPVGILVRVEGLGDDSASTAGRVSELLFYGTIAAAAPPESCRAPLPPTPPTSSPNGVADTPVRDATVELRVHALPLCSSRIVEGAAAAAALPPHVNGELPAAEGDQIEAQFLAPLSADQALQQLAKRRATDDIFAEATLRRRRAAYRGGQSVAAAAARVDDTPSAVPNPRALTRTLSVAASKVGAPALDTTRSPLLARGSTPTSAPAALARQSHSRSASAGLDTRPPSRKPTASFEKRSAVLKPETPRLALEPSLENRNREALARVVMAGMRMYGLQQQHPRRRTLVSTTTTPDCGGGGEDDNCSKGGETQPAKAADETSASAKEDELYKQIYHQTFKGAVLALVRLCLECSARRVWLRTGLLTAVAEKPRCHHAFARAARSFARHCRQTACCLLHRSAFSCRF